MLKPNSLYTVLLCKTVSERIVFKILFDYVTFLLLEMRYNVQGVHLVRLSYSISMCTEIIGSLENRLKDAHFNII